MNGINLTIAPVPTGSISYDTLRDRVIDLVAQKGEDYQGYPGAYFRPDGSPGCLLGELAAEDGATRSGLEVCGANHAGVSSLVEMGYLVPEDDRAYQALGLLQHYNDSGATWFYATCITFGMDSDELREEIERRKHASVAATVDIETYLDFVESFEQRKPTFTLSAPLVCSALPVEHVLVA